ncbi:peptidylprolyl isomerase [Dysgonomonas sp. 520]|uniref:peptidylprolyl isomerase n=1 Tax=Dysgonomonas sp. 520 TaxID=2302931 RepID=UPI0013D1AC1C|nr:peptidylprolyl isomerase [Dysgonomonas sp. 520]NDW08171.1 peptidylprolyl isomerase [Dysgonomonas sp. 520]
MTKHLYKVALLFLLLVSSIALKSQDNIADQVIWVVGDEAILKSEVEGVKMQMIMSGEKFDGDPDCLIPEQIAVQKLFLHQAKIDSIDVPMTNVNRQVDNYVNNAISRYGSKEKLEEYSGKTVSQLRDDWREQLRDNAITDNVKEKIVGTIKLTPSEVRKYYTQLSQDSLPFIPTTVEAQVITFEPKIPISEIDAVKNELRSFTERINKGESPFSSLALLYSQDTESAKKGGELGFMGRATLAPEFASAAFALTDPNKVSNIVETEFGFHIIQLIERRGDRINARHILLKPKVPQSEIDKTVSELDTIANKLRNNTYTIKDAFSSFAQDVDLLPEASTAKLTFDEAAQYISADKDTRNNKGLMVNNKNPYSSNYGTAKFTMEELPAEAAQVIDKMQIGEISKPFVMINEKGRQVVAIVKLKQRVERHKANVMDDYQILKSYVEAEKKEEILKKWVQDKIKNTYVRINDNWKNCDFQYQGWIK